MIGVSGFSRRVYSLLDVLACSLWAVALGAIVFHRGMLSRPEARAALIWSVPHRQTEIVFARPTGHDPIDFGQVERYATRLGPSGFP